MTETLAVDLITLAACALFYVLGYYAGRRQTLYVIRRIFNLSED